MPNESTWLKLGKEIPLMVAAKFDIDLPSQASKEIFEQIKEHCCGGCVLTMEED